MAIVWWGASLMGCGWRGGPGGLGFATVVMLIFGGWPKTFVRRTSAVYCRARPSWVGRLLRRRIAELLRASRAASGRLASRTESVNRKGVSVSW
jgi:hypothetical protein